jgi:hypothetical protein
MRRAAGAYARPWAFSKAPRIPLITSLAAWSGCWNPPNRSQGRFDSSVPKFSRFRAVSFVASTKIQKNSTAHIKRHLSRRSEHSDRKALSMSISRQSRAEETIPIAEKDFFRNLPAPWAIDPWDILKVGFFRRTTHSSSECILT